MELWSLYEVVVAFIEGEPTGKQLLFAALLAAGIGLIFFCLQGIALYVMAKRRGFRYKALAFVPFANIILMGRLAGRTTFFGQKIKRAGLYTMIAQIIITVIAVSYIGAEIYLHHSGCVYYQPVDDALTQYQIQWDHGSRFEKFLFNYAYDIVYFLRMIFGLVCEILMLTLLASLFKNYAPEGYVWLTVLAAFMPLSVGIILLVLRNRKAVDYQAYMRAKHEAQMRRYQQYYGRGGYNPYGGGSPYGGYQQSYGQPQYGQPNTQQKPPEDPFSEFASEKKQDEPFSEFSSESKNKTGEDSDGFFD